MRLPLALLLATTLGCEKPCEEPSTPTAYHGYAVGDPAGIIAHASEIGDGGVSDGCAAIRSCTERCALIRVPNGEPIAQDAGAPDVSACPAAMPMEGTPCGGAIKCPYARGDESCWASCNGSSWWVGCTKPTPPPPSDCPDAAPEVGSSCGRQRVCTVPGEGICTALTIQCDTTHGWQLRTCVAAPGEDWQVNCFAPVRQCVPIE